MSKSAVVFAGYFPTPFSLAVGEEFIAYFRQHYADCHFYVGLNPAACNQDFLRLLATSGLQYEVRIVPESLVVDSDASAYQAALLLLRDGERQDFDVLYFFHSNGATNPTSKQLREFFLPRFADRARIEAAFSHETVGSYSLFLGKSKNPFIDQLGEHYVFDRPYFYTYLYFHTIYALRARPVLDFVHGCQRSFFDVKLVERYFFERDFPHVVWRQGFVPASEFLVDWNMCFPASEVDFSADARAHLSHR